MLDLWGVPRANYFLIMVSRGPIIFLRMQTSKIDPMSLARPQVITAGWGIDVWNPHCELASCPPSIP